MRSTAQFIAASLAALAVGCQSNPPPQTWDSLPGVPDGFKDGVDDGSSDEQIRAAMKGHAVEVEVDPVFAASAAAGVKGEDLARWNVTSDTFDASAAKGITTDDVARWNATGAAFEASPGAAIKAEDVALWNAAAAWGNHAAAGYLKSETDPAFVASAAAAITSAKVTNWDAAVAWGNHASAGYLRTETDPTIGAQATGKVPVWDGAKLVSSTALSETNGKVGIGATPSASAALTVSTLATFGASFTTTTSKSCTMATNFNWTNRGSSAAACNTYCTTQGFAGGSVGSSGSKNCGGASCSYISDFDTCATATKQNDGNCDSCAPTFSCTCNVTGTELKGNVRVLAGNVGVGVASPRSPLQVGGYLQLGTTSGAPPAADCDEAAERARMLVDPATGQLWVCVNSGWVAK